MGRGVARIGFGSRVFLVAMLAVGTPAVGHATSAAAAAPGDVARARLVRTVWTNDFGIPRPTGLAFVASRNEFVVAGSPSSTTPLVRIARDETARGTLELPALTDPSTLSFDPAANELSAVSDDQLVVAPGSGLTSRRPATARADLSGLALREARGATYDPATGTWFVLDARAPAIVRIGARGTRPSAPARIPLAGLQGRTLRGLAFNPADGLLYVNADAHLLYGLDRDGQIAKTFDVGDAGVRNPVAMTFAPSTDKTDAPANQNLFVADAGDTSTLGGVTELTLAPQAALAAPVDSATLVRTINTAAFSPGSPDPSGVTYIPSSDRLEICDSEVEETTGAGYHGVNMWQLTRTGTVTDTGTTYPAISKEPNGLGYIAASNTMLISDDSLRVVHLMKAGPDGRFGTSDDVVSFIDAFQYGSDDTEDPAFDPVSGDIFFVDGLSQEVFRIHAVNGVFGDSDDTMTHFDVGQYGITDTEALAYYAPNDTLIVGDRTGRRLLEVTKTGALVRTIDLTGIPGLGLVSGLTVAPSSTTPGQLNFWIVDRGVDNGANPNENDGKLYEVSAGPTNNTPPVVDSATITPTAPTTNATLSVNVTAHDDDNDPLTYRYQWRKNSVAIPNATGPTLDLSLAGNGDKGDQISVRVTAFDGIIESAPRTSAQVTVVDSPPAFNQNLGNRTDGEGATVSLSAAATDPDNDPLTYAATGLPPGLGINATTGLISGQITAGAAANSPYAASITVRQGATPDATDTFTWTVTGPGTPPVITPGVVSTPEGNSGTHVVNVPVTLDHASASTVTVQYQTIEPAMANGAKVPGDYAATSGTVTFTPGQTAKTVPVVINGDPVREADELVIISFTNPTNATLGGFFGLGVITITNDDPLPKVVPGVVTTAEGNSGSHVVNVPVTLDRASSATVTVHYQTIEPSGVANLAHAPGDYTAKSGTLTFAPGQTTATVAITVKGDVAREANEMVIISFTNASNATIGGFFGLGVITINNDD
jgi:hypothetical protein